VWYRVTTLTLTLPVTNGKNGNSGDDKRMTGHKRSEGMKLGLGVADMMTIIIPQRNWM
jgi:hypothetical protein